jgi:hypothetical protein
MTIVVSSSLWGNKAEYTQGAILTARQIQNYNKANRLPKLAFWVYFDDTAPKPVLQKLRNYGARCIRGPAWQGERRAMWRFLALGEARAVITLDVDDNICHTLLTDRFCLRMLRQMDRAGHDQKPGIWVWKALWQHCGKFYVPAGLFGAYVNRPLNNLQRDIEQYIGRSKPMCGQGRYGDGYGLDEEFLTNHLVRQLRTQQQCRVHATGIGTKHRCCNRV